MNITECIRLDKFVDKNIRKHHFEPQEVEEMLSRNPFVRKLEDGDVQGEDLFIAFGKTQAGRYLSILVVLKKGNRALVISARDMTDTERQSYAKHKKS